MVVRTWRKVSGQSNRSHHENVWHNHMLSISSEQYNTYCSGVVIVHLDDDFYLLLQPEVSNTG